jgi:hypothetical protein
MDVLIIFFPITILVIKAYFEVIKMILDLLTKWGKGR